jgi:hypothetical protein
MKNNNIWITTSIIGMLFIYVLNGLSSTLADPDLWGYLAFGRLFWESGKFPYQDVYSYVPTLNPWVYHEWLTGVIFYPLYIKTGASGLQLLKYFFGLLTLTLVYFTARRRGADPLGTAVVLFIISGFLLVGYSPVRAQIFTYFFFALTLYLLERARLSGRWHVMGAIPIFMILWCNLHGGFVSGLCLIALYALGEAIARRPFLLYLGILLLSGMATLINPYGLKYWFYILHAVTMPRPEISEWGSIFQIYRTGLSLVEITYYSLIIVISLLLMSWGKWREITASLTLGVTLYIGLAHTRHIVFFLILVGAYMPAIVTPFFQRVKSWPGVISLKYLFEWKFLFLLIASVMVLGGYKFISKTPWTLQIPSKPGSKSGMYYPVVAVDFIQTHHLFRNLLIDFDWGEYALWRLYPQCRVALDGRYETVYPEPVAKEYFDFLFGRNNWQQFLKHHPPDMILIKIPSKVYSLLKKEPHWRQVFADSGSALFLRRN